MGIDCPITKKINVSVSVISLSNVFKEKKKETIPKYFYKIVSMTTKKYCCLVEIMGYVNFLLS